MNPCRYCKVRPPAPRTAVCSECRAARARARYESDPEYRARRNEQNRRDYHADPRKHLDRQAERMRDPALREIQLERTRASMAKRRVQWVAHLGGACVQCGSPEDLHFDHIHWQEKRVEVSRLVCRDVTDLEASTEFAKCQLLCAECHYAKSVIDRREMRRIKRADPPS